MVDVSQDFFDPSDYEGLTEREERILGPPGNPSPARPRIVRCEPSLACVKPTN